MAEIAYPGTDRYSMAEFMAIVFARDMAGPEERGGGGGADNLIPLAAGRLAQLTVCPNFWLGGGGAGMVTGEAPWHRLPLGTWDPRLNAGAEFRRYMMDRVDSGTRGRVERPNTRSARGGGAGGGGMQIDKYGNTNMLGIGGPYPKLTVRGPGTVGNIWSATGGGGGRYTQHHNRRVLVEKVDYITGPGWLDGGDSREKVYPGTRGPDYIFTPICIFDFTEDEHRARLVSVHPGYTVKDVLDNTGFEPVIPANVPQTTPPSDGELEMLRTGVDRDGVLRKYKRLTVG
ncbi:MAG: hypothetical protein HY667_03820 [Chloroflexi bacterium]|nr:hypothetical protein [Chloroflexota bacterium]